MDGGGITTCHHNKRLEIVARTRAQGCTQSAHYSITKAWNVGIAKAKIENLTNSKHKVNIVLMPKSTQGDEKSFDL
jgi:hypothetical protein